MANGIEKLNIQVVKPVSDAKEGLDCNYTEPDLSNDEQYFLSITGRFAPKDYALFKVEKKEEADVYNGSVNSEINKLQNEQEQINNILAENTKLTLNSVLNDTLNSEPALQNAKKIGFIEYAGGNVLNTKTDTTNILNNIQYANNDEKKVVEGAITLLTDWLDEYITNYDAKIAEGINRGDSEVKLSFLLEIRKAIENVDFPIGFGDYSAPEDQYTLGSYSFNLGGYDNYYHLNTDRSILLNAKYLMPTRNYTSYQEIIDAATLTPDTQFSYTDIVFASDEGYYNYCTNYMASVLVHELTHSLHIYNEAVTYYTNDAFDDDFYTSAVEGVDQTFLNQYFGGISITYGSLGISHELNSFEEAVSHGHDKNMDYQTLYVDKGFTIVDDRNELYNFVYKA